MQGIGAIFAIPGAEALELAIFNGDLATNSLTTKSGKFKGLAGKQESLAGIGAVICKLVQSQHRGF
jgi:hypothetical protein